jgi:hypothetical protein
VDLSGLRDNLSSGRFGVIPAGLEINKDTPLTEEICRDLPHVTIALLGRFKGETGVDQHLISLANESVSGLKTRWWIEKLVSVCQAEGSCMVQAWVDHFVTSITLPKGYSLVPFDIR